MAADGGSEWAPFAGLLARLNAAGPEVPPPIVERLQAELAQAGLLRLSVAGSAVQLLARERPNCTLTRADMPGFQRAVTDRGLLGERDADALMGLLLEDLRRAMCTAKHPGGYSAVQLVFACEECGVDGEELGLCGVCVAACHVGHRTRQTCEEGLICDCAEASGTCAATADAAQVRVALLPHLARLPHACVEVNQALFATGGLPPAAETSGAAAERLEALPSSSSSSSSSGSSGDEAGEARRAARRSRRARRAQKRRGRN